MNGGGFPAKREPVTAANGVRSRNVKHSPLTPVISGAVRPPLVPHRPRNRPTSSRIEFFHPRGSPGTFLQAAVLNDGLGAWRNAMLHLFLTPSPLLVAGEALVGISLPMFVAALIAAFGHKIRLSVGW